MSTLPKYRDKRSEFWREHFAAAVTYDRYLEGSDPIHAAKWAGSTRYPGTPR